MNFSWWRKGEESCLQETSMATLKNTNRSICKGFIQVIIYRIKGIVFFETLFKKGWLLFKKP
jgi:hypothetical protein